MALKDDPAFTSVAVVLHETVTYRLAQMCKRKGMSRTDYLRQIIADSLDRDEREVC